MSREKVLCGKGEIIQVAVGIVDREGMEAVSIRRIAKELGVSSMTIYNYVENLQDVKKYVLISGFDRMYSRIFEALNASPGVGGSAGVCRAVALEVFRFADKNRGMFTYMYSDGRLLFHQDAEVRPFYDFFAKCIKRGRRSRDEWMANERCFRLFETLVFTMADQHCTGVKSQTEDEFLEYVDFYLDHCMPGKK